MRSTISMTQPLSLYHLISQTWTKHVCLMDEKHSHRLKNSAADVLSVGIMNYGQKMASVRPNFSPAFKQKNSLIHDIESIDSLQNHPKSFMGCIKIIIDDGEAMA
jgi:hypothetical protein